MKKTVKKIVSIVLVLSMLISSIFVLTAHAEETDEIVYNSSMDKYFSELKDNVPGNVIGSCGYQIASLFLAYYDTYWNDCFVPNTYESDDIYGSSSLANGYSTIKTENSLWISQYTSSGTSLTYADYIDSFYPSFVEAHRGEGYLHLDLIGLGIDSGYYSGLVQKEKYSITMYEIGTIIDEYFDGIFGERFYFDPNGLFISPDEDVPVLIKMLDSDDLGCSNEQVINKMYELVDSGIPVLYRGSNGSSGHVMIAYDTIKESGAIVDCEMHTGWSDDEETTDVKEYFTTLSATEYDSDISILWFEIDESLVPHAHSNNYHYSATESYCSCEVYGELHPEHIHESDGVYLSYGTSSHVSKCRWDGEEITETHKHVGLSISSSLHTLTCACGHSYTESHVLEKITINLYRCMHCNYTRNTNNNENVHLGVEEDEDTE